MGAHCLDFPDVAAGNQAQMSRSTEAAGRITRQVRRLTPVRITRAREWLLERDDVNCATFQQSNRQLIIVITIILFAQ